MMWTSKYLAARVLIWLAAIAVPLQGVPAKSCGCVDSKTCCQKDTESNCCWCRSAEKARGWCCSARRQAAAHACCGDHTGQKSGCQCGSRCQCGQSKPPQPTAPPVESNTPAEKVVSDGASAAFIADVVLPEVAQSHFGAAIELGTATALDRCVFLCRFTI
jgi:hypothetical protein